MSANNEFPLTLEYFCFENEAFSTKMMEHDGTLADQTMFLAGVKTVL